jgi:acetyl-CoA carboxylase carboxyltransferase component
VQTKPLALLPLQSEKIPLVFVQDVTFMVGSKSEQGGIIKTVQNG